MEWPHRFLEVVLAVGAAAVLVPWLIPRILFASLIRLIPFVAAMGCWISYGLGSMNDNLPTVFRERESSDSMVPEV